jgi:hypothetical protein
MRGPANSLVLSRGACSEIRPINKLREYLHERYAYPGPQSQIDAAVDRIDSFLAQQKQKMLG